MPDDVIKGKIVFDTRGIKKAAKGFGAGPSQAAAAVPRTDKNISTMSKGIGKMAAGFAAGMAVWEGIKGLMGKLVSSSPQLQASINILKKSFEFMLRPIGDAIGGALRPFALAWLKFGLKWYKDVGPKMEKWFSELVDNTSDFGKGFLGEEGLLGGDIGTVLGDLFKDAVPAAFIETWDQLKETLSSLWKFLSVDMLPIWQILGSILGVLIVGALKLIKFNLELLQRGLEFLGPILQEVGAFLADQLAPVFEALPGIIDTVVTKMSDFGTAIFDFFTITIPGAWTKLKDSVVSSVGAIKDKITGIWDSLVNEASIFWDALKNTIVDAWDSLKAAINSVIDSIIAKIASIPLIGGIVGGEAAAGPVAQDFVMRGDKVTRFSPQDNIMGFKGDSPQQGGMTTNVEINISALDASSIDDNVIQKITNGIDDAQRRGLLSRTLQGTGV